MSLTCPSCHGLMVAHSLEGHLGTTVTIDLCQTCQAFWFDERESLQLTPGSTLRLFREIGEGGQGAKGPGGRGTADEETVEAHCPRCNMRLRPVHDLQRTTRFQYLRCPAKHGRFISFIDFLREKNFIRPMTADQIETLRRNVQTVNCSNCGAPIDLAKTSACGHCGSPLSMLDLQQARTLIEELRQADAGKAAVDPALPMRLAQARRDVASSFDTFESSPSWYQNVSGADLVQAGIRTLIKWLE